MHGMTVALVLLARLDMMVSFYTAS
jgi:hypothetical protein